MQTITPVTVDPNGTTVAAMAAGTTFNPEGGNAVECCGVAQTGSGRLYLMRNLGPDTSTQWDIVDNDAQDLKSIQADATKPPALPGYFSGTWMTGDTRSGSRATYCIFSDGGVTAFKRILAGGRRL